MSATDTQTLVRAPDPQEALQALCRDGHRRAHSAELRAELARIGAELERPLQLAVAGAVSAGKSTLINAVLGRPVAPADAGECTRIVTWYEFGDDDGLVIVERRDAGPVHLRLQQGQLPSDLGVPIEDVLRLRVQLREPWLREVTVIDTPGMNTVRAENEDATRRLLFGDAAAEHAQALLYVLRHVQRFDADTLAEFRALSGAAGMTAVNTAAVLSHIDRVADDPWPDARRLGARAARSLQGSVLDVAPVAGLLAETARAELLGEPELAALTHLAALEPDLLEDLLLDLDEFADDDSDVALPAPVRAALIARLHRYGILVAVAHLRQHPRSDLAALHRALAEGSGYGDAGAVDPGAAPSIARIIDRFTRHARRLTAFAAMARIRRLGRIRVPAQDLALVRELRDTVDDRRQLAAGLGALRILAAGAALSRGQLLLDADMTAELMQMAREDDAAAQLGLPVGSPRAAVADRAREATTRWRRVALSAGPTIGGHRAHDVLTVLEALVASLSAHDPPALASDEGAPPAPRPPAPSDPHPDPDPVPGPPTGPQGSALETARLTRLAGSPLIPGPEREVLTALVSARTAARAVGLPRHAGPEEVRAAATALAGRFRVLMHRPLPAAERNTVRAVCDLYESIALNGSPAARDHRSTP